MKRLLDRLRLRIRSLLRGSDVDAALKDEIRVHLAEQVDELIAGGMDPSEARAAALRSFGPVTVIEDECRDARRVAPIEHLLQDLRYSFRSLAAQPMLVGASLLSITIAIGANTSIFSIATTLMFATPTARAPEDLVHIRLGGGSHVSHRLWRDLSESGALEGIVGFNIETSLTWRDGELSRNLVPLIVSENFFDVLGVPMSIGRGFTAAEARTERDPAVAVISHRFWQASLNGDPSVLGRTLVLNGRSYSVLGVLPHGARSIMGFGLAPEIYVPLGRSLAPDLDSALSGALQLVGRLRADQSLEEGRAAVATVAGRLAGKYGEKRFGRVDQFARAGSMEMFGNLATVGFFFGVLLAGVSMVLAIACANVAGLLLARATVRTREMAVRVALGASRRRLVQQLLTEGFWIAVGGTALGLLLMRLLTTTLARISMPLPVPLELHTRVEGRLLAYTVLLTVVTTVLCALAPALQATKRAQWPALRQGDRPGSRWWSFRNGLVIGQLAVALVLLVTASLFLRNLSRAQGMDPGFDVENTMVGLVGFVEGRYTDETRTGWLERAAERAGTLPGVAAAGYAYGAPLTVRSGMSTGADLTIEGSGVVFPASYDTNFVGPGFFDAIGIPVLKGRTFRREDRRGTPQVAIVNQEFVRRYLGNREPIGVRLRLPGPRDVTYPVEIIGVVGNSRFRTLGEEQRPAIYEAYAQRSHAQRVAHVFVRLQPGASVGPRDIAGALAALDRSTAVEVKTMRDTLAFAFMPSRVGAALLGALGVLGLLLAMAGLFAVVSYAVSRRTGEIGIRMALGAGKRQVTGLVLRDAAVLALIGVALGSAAAWFLTRPLALFLVAGVAGDPMPFAAAASALGLTSFVAAWVPARRAVRIDPIAALRFE
jgi:predicted permease